ncbi:arabinose efflux permease family protein [Mycolicibacterium chubuense NBB4]|uniref:Arabinose efflux permease family protein n=1 Tax=Mycolicibacterium chubuense (strain NBB4) TaxID=710421 RepID=I4BF59_MYCCN|nr:MFS transporter [Mycolicibacterium chubuense]AFM15916.1 arabinose efflux permease family protein [Mycolicibacterium chubuense NBB4]
MSATEATTPTLTRTAGIMTIVAMGLGYTAAIADPTILSANMSAVRVGLQILPSTASFIASLATLTMAATVLGAGALGDIYGMRRMYVIGLLGTMTFGASAAAAPTAGVLMLARAGTGVALAILLGVSLAVVSTIFAAERRTTVIAWYFGVGVAFSAPLPVISSLLATHWGWRACFLVVPAVAAAALVITVRWVPETPRAARAPDVGGLTLAAVALLALVFGAARLETGVDVVAITALCAGAVAGTAFIVWEARSAEPAVDLSVFRSRRFDAAVVAGVAFNFLAGGLMILFAFYLVTVRGDSMEVLGVLLIPATVLAAVAATAAGPAAARFGERAVLILGLAVMLAAVLLLTWFDEKTGLAVVFAAVALTAVGGAIVATPQASIMMAAAPPRLGGAVAGVKSAVNQAGYSLGPTIFALVGIDLILRGGAKKLAGSGISLQDAREAFRATHGGPAGSAHLLEPEKARIVATTATQSMLDAIHTLGLVMAVVPVAAIVVAVVLISPHRACAGCRASSRSAEHPSRPSRGSRNRS